MLYRACEHECAWVFFMQAINAMRVGVVAADNDVIVDGVIVNVVDVVVVVVEVVRSKCVS